MQYPQTNRFVRFLHLRRRKIASAWKYRGFAFFSPRQILSDFSERPRRSLSFFGIRKRQASTAFRRPSGYFVFSRPTRGIFCFSDDRCKLFRFMRRKRRGGAKLRRLSFLYFPPSDGFIVFFRPLRSRRPACLSRTARLPPSTAFRGSFPPDPSNRADQTRTYAPKDTTIRRPHPSQSGR